uniref:Uncharacterized protein n=1 Tax=uncultured prokaryote TaxID=198431 RepID=A0A0H5QQX8_9ZZZZ|nr:hypothetical protein [uncultured prokaryote]
MGYKFVKHLESANYNRKLFFLDRGAIDLPPIVNLTDIMPGSESRSLSTGEKWVLNTHYKWVWIGTGDCCCSGGPSNRFVNKGIGQLPTGDMISVITLSEGAPIVVIAPTLSLDSAVFAQVATLMGKVEELISKVEAMEEEHEQCAQTHQSLRDDIDDIKEALGM